MSVDELSDRLSKKMIQGWTISSECCPSKVW